PREWQNRFIAGRPSILARPERDGARPARDARRVRRSGFHQARVLTARYARLFLRDRRNVLILLAQIPVLALAIAGLFKVKVFVRPSSDAGQAVKVTFLLLV